MGWTLPGEMTILMEQGNGKEVDREEDGEMALWYIQTWPKLQQI